MSHQLERVTDRRKVFHFGQSLANRKEPYRRVIELWQCSVCRSYWEYVRLEPGEDGAMEEHRWSFEVLRGRQGGGCL